MFLLVILACLLWEQVKYIWRKSSDKIKKRRIICDWVIYTSALFQYKFVSENDQKAKCSVQTVDSWTFKEKEVEKEVQNFILETPISWAFVIDFVSSKASNPSFQGKERKLILLERVSEKTDILWNCYFFLKFLKVSATVNQPIANSTMIHDLSQVE